ncbi:MAG: DUF4012 domain-containing protein [Candidatus Doudnabacteria bacterium]|nr:DUF4012 domain-containing protein [Candidatus Doudnabacteria bacterium]
MNLAYHSKQQRKRRKRTEKKRSPKRALLIGAVILIVLGGGALVMAPAAADAYYSSLSARDQLLSAQDALKQQDLGIARSQIELAHMNFERAEDASKKLLPLRLIPYAGRQVKATRNLILAGVEITGGLEEALVTLERVVVPLGENEATSFEDVTVEQKREVLKNLSESAESLDEASARFARAEELLDNTPDTALVGPLSDAVLQVQDQLPALAELMETVALASRIVPQLAGYPEQQEYLLLFQNNTELRPSGGFIGSYGVLTAKDGDIADLVTADSYALDDPFEGSIPAPWQFKKLTNPDLKSWYFRDSNWSPDFPTAAENALWFYKEEGGEGDFAGVVSFTPTFLENLLGVIGPVTLPGRSETFTEENVTSLIQFETNVSFRLLETRKDVIGDLANVILDRVLTLPRSQWLEFGEAVQTGFAEKHVMLYMRDTDAQAVVEGQGWGAAIDREDHVDYVQYVDANMASLKTDPFVSRSAEYIVDFAPERPRATYTIHYTNEAPGFSFKTTRYRSWARLFVPEGSDLVSIEGQDTAPDFYEDPSVPYEVIKEDGLNKVSFGTFIVTEIGETRDVTFTYDLPKEIGDAARRGEYNLVMQKQPGVISADLTVDFVNLPNEKSIQGEGEQETADAPFIHELRRDAIWAMPKSDLRPSEPLTTLF